MAYNLQSFMQRIAAVAVRLKTPRKINGVDFDGTQDITINAGGGGSPGGADNQIQYNNDGDFAGDSGLVYSGGNLAIASGKSYKIGETSVVRYDGSYTYFNAANSNPVIIASAAALFFRAPQSNADIRFQVAGGSVMSMYLKADGNVGINNTTPTEKLDVVGNAKVSGTIQGSFKASDGSAGATGTFTTADSKTVTVTNGIITNIA